MSDLHAYHKVQSSFPVNYHVTNPFLTEAVRVKCRREERQRIREAHLAKKDQVQ
jgi:hypothetical protein